MRFDTNKKFLYKRPTDEILWGFYFRSEEIYTIDGWYSCPETEGEWFLSKSGVIFQYDPHYKWYTSSVVENPHPHPDFKNVFSSREECERLFKLKLFW